MPDKYEMPILPEGIGMNLEQVQKLLADQHKTIVSLDDPVLIMVTIMNAFLSQQNALLERHKTAMVNIMTEKTNDYVAEVKTATKSLSAAMSDLMLAAIQKTMNDHSLTLANHKKDTMWLSAIVAISALINVVVFIFT